MNASKRDISRALNMIVMISKLLTRWLQESLIEVHGFRRDNLSEAEGAQPLIE